MKKTLKYIFPLIAVCMALTTGCRDYAYDYLEFNPDDAPEMTEPGIKISSDTLMISATADPEAITVTALGGEWSIEKDPSTDGSWITGFSTTSGKDGNTVVGLQVQRNNAMTERYAKLLIKQPATGTTKEVTIGQYTFESEFNRHTDSLALVAIYKGYGGDKEEYGWANKWNLRKPITEWHSITVEEVNGEMRVVGFKVQDSGTWYGPLNKAIGNLRELRTLIVPSPTQYDIPPTFINLRKLEEFTIAGSYCKIYIPVGIGNMISLKKLNLGQATVDGTSFANLYELEAVETVSMSDKDTYGEMPDGISAMVKLKSLQIGGTSISRLPNDIGNLPLLETLNLANCGSLTSIPESVCMLTSLKSLSLGNSAITSIPENIGDLQNLTSLGIYACAKLTSIPDSFARLKISGELSLSGCKELIQLPENIGEMVNITKLNLNGCEALMALPSSLGNILKEVNITGCKSLTSIPDGIMKMQNLEKLTISSCPALKSLPENFGTCPKLSDLTLSSTAFATLPASFGQLTTLTRITMYADKEFSMTADLGATFGTLINLQELSSSNNAFTGGFSWVKNMPKLTKLSLSGIKPTEPLNLNDFPVSIVSISLGYNKEITGTIDGISRLVNATTINLQDNKLSGTLPTDLGNNQKLTSLNLQDNDIEGNLPASLANGKFSSYGLNLKNNKLSGEIPVEILKHDFWKNWKTYILTQKPGYGFSNGN